MEKYVYEIFCLPRGCVTAGSILVEAGVFFPVKDERHVTSSAELVNGGVVFFFFRVELKTSNVI